MRSGTSRLLLFFLPIREEGVEVEEEGEEIEEITGMMTTKRATRILESIIMNMAKAEEKILTNLR